MALDANGHLGQEKLADDRDKTLGYVEIVEPNDRAYFKAELLDINPEIRQCYVRYERPRTGLKAVHWAFLSYRLLCRLSVVG